MAASFSSHFSSPSAWWSRGDGAEGRQAMRILKEYGTGSGALLAVLGLIMNTVVPERRAYSLSMGGLGVALLAAGVALNFERVLAFLKGKRGRAVGASAGYTLTVMAV